MRIAEEEEKKDIAWSCPVQLQQEQPAGMQTVIEIKAELKCKSVLLQFNDGSHSFLKVSGEHVALETIQLGSDVVGDAALLFTIQDANESTFKLVSKVDPAKRLAFDAQNGHLMLCPPASPDATTFRFTNAETTLALLPVLLSGNGQDGKLVDLVADPAIPAENPKFKQQLALRVIDAVEGELQTLDPDDYLAYAVSHLPLSEDPGKHAVKTFFPDLPNPVLGLVNAISMNPDVQSGWAAALLSKKSDLEQWCTDCEIGCGESHIS